MASLNGGIGTRSFDTHLHAKSVTRTRWVDVDQKQIRHSTHFCWKIESRKLLLAHHETRTFRSSRSRSRRFPFAAYASPHFRFIEHLDIHTRIDVTEADHTA